MHWEEINERYVTPAVALWRSDKPQEAEAIFKEGLSATYNDGYVSLHYAEFLESSGRLQDAMDMFDLAHSRLPMEKYKTRARQGLERIRRTLAHRTRKQPVETNSQPRTHQRIALLSCTKRKKEHICTARELYSESEKFKRELEIAENNYDRTFVVSSRHALVKLTQLLSPYERRLDEYTDEERKGWAVFVAGCLRLEGISEGDEVFIHASNLYAADLREALEKKKINVFVVDTDPLPLK